MSVNTKHIAIFDYSFSIGGVERVFISYAEAFVRKGYIVDIVLCNEDGALTKMLPDNVNIVNLGKIRYRTLFKHLRAYIKTHQPSVLITGHELDNFTAVLVNMSLPKNKRPNLIVSQHSVPNLDDTETSKIGYLFPLGKRLFYRYANSTIAISNFVAADLKKAGVPANKIHRVYNPIDIKQVEENSQQEIDIQLPENFIVFVGRFNGVKNLDLLLKAFDLLVDDSIDLVVVGDGLKNAEWRNMANQMKKSNKIHFIGGLTNPIPIINKAKVVAVPSLSEGLSMVTIEAIILGKTVAHTPNKGCLEVLSSNLGKCSQSFNDPQDFADTLTRAIESPINPAFLKERAKTFSIEEFSKTITPLL